MELEELFLRFIEQYHEVLREVDATESEKSNLPDITIHQFFYLREIQRKGETTLTELAQALDVSKPSATAAVTKLTKDGFINRTQSSKDQRKFYLSLSEQGHQIFRHKQEAYRSYIRKVSEHTTGKQQKILVEAFEIMASCFQDDPGITGLQLH